ncbi:MAG: hypothetical protein WD577_06905 [Bacteroidales bacterium]
MSRLITTFDNSLGILILTVENQLAKQFVIDYYNGLAKNNEYPRDLRVICFVTTTNYQIRPEDIDEMVDSLKQASGNYERLTEAFVAEDPYSTVITTLFSEKAQIRNYRSKVFSTKEAALKWLLD